MKRVLALCLFLGAIVSCREAPDPLSNEDSALRRDASEATLSAAGVIPGRFIVTLWEGARPQEVAAAHGVRPDFVYHHALVGFAGSISEAARQELFRDFRVRRIEPDGVATAWTEQSNATWGLDRIDQRNRPIDTKYHYTNTGAGVNAYIIDTGIRISHSEFGGRATSGIDIVGGDNDADDCNGHGTHVAGTVGGETYGVAKQVNLIAVRVLNCSGSGTWSGVIAGVDFVTGEKQTHPGTDMVANMSLGGGANSSVDNAVSNSIAEGVSYAVAAGNSSQNACNFSPARTPNAMTIGATNSTDARPSWSNVGSCVDWFAPGSGITSAWIGSNTATNTISGTSMASPHTAGVAALYLDASPGASPATVRQGLFDLTTKGIVRKARSANNHLLFTNL